VYIKGIFRQQKIKGFCFDFHMWRLQSMVCICVV